MSESIVEQADKGKRRCVRIGSDGSQSVDVREPDVVRQWVRFNQDFRPGTALFVDGDCVDRGSRTKEDCDQISAQMKNMAIAA